jgi:Putative Actinobacterial Holin-X, holin superfamily III
MTPRPNSASEDRAGAGELFIQLAGELGHLLAQHVALARLELGETARGAGKGVAQIAACAPLVLVGYAFLNAALALVLTRWIPLPGAVALVGLLNVACGVLGVVTAARSFRRPLLDDSVVELERTARALSRNRQAHPALESRHDG